MMRATAYLFEHVLVAATILLGVLGFWTIFFGDNAAPNLYHYLHAATVFVWMLLLLYQLRLIANKRYGDHRRAGLAVMAIGPLLFATSALLTVHSAQKGVVSESGDPLVVQNVMTTLALGLLILFAFVLRQRRKLHGAFILSTAILFMGIALFFTLISFVPQYKIEGPETFGRFQSAYMTFSIICAVVGLLLFVKDFRNGWPYLMAGSSFTLMELTRSLLARNGLIAPLTEFVGSMNQIFAFVGSFGGLFAALAVTGILNAKTRRGTGNTQLKAAD